MTQLSLGLALALISAVAVNWAYSREHDAAAVMPRFSPRRPLHFVSLLLGDRRWLSGFATETAGWLVYVAALRLAPISLVQAVCASGIAVLALASAHGHPSTLARHEQLAVVIALAGLVLLAVSLVDSHQADHPPHSSVVLLWLSGSAGAAAPWPWSVSDSRAAPPSASPPEMLFAGGDISAKLVVYGGTWILAAFALVAFYALGTSVLQGSFQHGDALTGAGLATLATNAVPIAAGFVVFGEHLPAGAKGALQLAAFAALVGSGVLLARGPRSRTRRSDASLRRGGGGHSAGRKRRLPAVQAGGRAG